ncbi:MAG: DUF116 domain-containing protein [Gemmatimonadetes bacterium]|nr:DUF116 domain-containing protein [Gemmatimonadota bacterium]
MREERGGGLSDPLQGCEPSEPQLLQLRSDRRLGHEWDDWDGEALPNDGVFVGRPALFFALLASYFAVWGAVAGVFLWLVTPRLAQWLPAIPTLLGAVVLALTGASFAWLGLVAASFALGHNLLSRRLCEGGLLPWLLPAAETAGRWVGIRRDVVGNAALQVYNKLAARRARRGLASRDVLVLLPRCLGKEGMQGALDVTARYGVPVFVAARGRYAREMIARQRPKAVVAVACERDLVSGVHDVAGRLPVLGTTLGLPDGPCKNTTVNLGSLETQIRKLLAITPAPTPSG